MSASLNLCFFMGNLTRDPEVKFTPKGTAVAEIGIAVNESYTTEGGEKRETVTFLNLEAWGRTAEIAGEYLKKGRLAHFQCKAKLETWDDKQSGQKRSKIKFLIEKLTLMPDGKREHGGSEEEEQRHTSSYARREERRPNPPPPPPRRPTASDPDLDAPADDDDVPF